MAFPEAKDARLLEAASKAEKREIAAPIFVGGKPKMVAAAKRFRIPISGIPIIDISSGIPCRYASAYAKLRKVPRDISERIRFTPLFLAAFLVQMGEIEAMVATAVFTSADAITTSEGIIGLRKGVSIPPSFFIMEIPNYKGGENGPLLFADHSVNIDPDSPLKQIL
ncbi:MAG: phosphate acyltransferase [Candidatus Bilamarchaeaceae archaeon]